MGRKRMNPTKIRDQLFNKLEKYGAINWHTSSNGSHYIKFKDTRLGSIRIADHKGRHWYSYKYTIDTNVCLDIKKQMEIICLEIEHKIKSLNLDFNPENYIVYNKDRRQYEKVKNYEAYKNRILKKG